MKATAGFLAAALMATPFCASPAAAQADAMDVVSGGFLSPAPRARVDIFEACATRLEIPDLNEEGCTVVEALDLGTPVEAWLLRYQRPSMYESGDVSFAIDVEEFVLAEAAGSGYRIVWRLPVQEYMLGRAVDIGHFGDASVIGFYVCARGTGGCAQQFLARDGGGWSVVAQPYLSGLAGLAPADWTLHKGRTIDLRSLTGVQPLAGPEDPNCCPSGMIRFSVAFQGGALVLGDATVEVPEPEEEPEDSLPDGA
ncbi:MAG: hypothetical protein ABFS34_12955 [Gemmatimonadota bacterium]